MIRYNTIAFLLIMLLLSSCATLLDEKGQKTKGIFITSNVPDAKVFNSKNQLIGTTPFLYNPSKSIGLQTLTIEKDQYESQKITIEKKEKAGFAFLDAMLLCIPCLVDYPTGNIYTYNQDSFSLYLKRIYDKDVERVSFVFEETDWNVADGSIIGKSMNDAVYFKKSSYASYLYKSISCDGQNYNRYKIINCNEDLSRQNTLLINANSILIKPIVTNLRTKFFKEKGVYYTTVNATVTWSFSKRSGKIIKEVQQTIVKKSDRADTKTLLARGMSEALSKIIDNDTNYNLFIAESKSTQEQENLFNEVKIEPNKTPTFNKNKDLIGYLMKGVVTIKHGDGHGSGFFISNDGYMITNYHVIKDKKQVDVQLNESITLTAELVRGDEIYDVALLKVSGQNFRGLALINSDSAQTGEDVFAIGTPSDISLGQSVTKGIISGKRKIGEKIYLQTDVSINSGNSGGPLLNENGEIVGMVTMKMVGDGIEGIGFCVPSNTIMEKLNIKIQPKK